MSTRQPISTAASCPSPTLLHPTLSSDKLIGKTRAASLFPSRPSHWSAPFVGVQPIRRHCRLPAEMVHGLSIDFVPCPCSRTCTYKVYPLQMEHHTVEHPDHHIFLLILFAPQQRSPPINAAPPPSLSKLLVPSTIYQYACSTSIQRITCREMVISITTHTHKENGQARACF